ncbi:hypothetical protein [Flavobacterium sp.]|uniref:hypothetical protein n=1 Tax=Flavobacterium sp. TaxID=239 RepID=UPI003BE7047D
MNIITRFLLIFFISFLATPTIIAVVKKSTDISIFYSFNEEELHKDFKEIKADLSNKCDFLHVNYSVVTSSKIISENLSRHDNVSEEIFSPPPKTV